MKVLFHLPSQLQLIGSNKVDSPTFWPQMVLAYIEWYTPPTLSLGEHASHNMATVKHAHPQADGSLPWSIIPLSNIRQSCMLLPNFRRSPFQSSWTSSNILDSADSFLVNNWASVYNYKTIYRE